MFTLNKQFSLFKKKLYIYPALFFIIITIWIGLDQVVSPNTVESTGILTEFSSERAMQHLKRIAVSPHPIGSNEHDRVRDEIINTVESLGFKPIVQKTTGVNESYDKVVLAGNVENIIVKIKGKKNSKAILVTAHYDSVATGPGAGDDGVGVAAMLEILHAIKAGPQLENDLIFLFSDGEEAGLLGAEAFNKESSLISNIGLVINLEARGNKGPSIMFETSEGNGHLIKGLSKGSNYALSSSLFYSFYKILPNNTDFTVYKKSEIPGMNFAFGGGLNAYHTSLDTVETIDERSIQHHGANALDMVRYFGNKDILHIKSTDVVYFNIFKYKIIYYSEEYVIPITIIVNLLFISVLLYAIKNNKATIGKVILSFISFLLFLVFIGGIATVIWKIIILCLKEYEWLLVSDNDFGIVILISISVISLCLFLIFSRYLCKVFNVYNVALGCLLVWVLFMITTSLFLPGGSYLFTWPLLFSIIGMFYTLYQCEKKLNSVWGGLINIIFVLPGILLFTPILYLLFIFLTLNYIGVLMILVILVFSLLIPYFYLCVLMKGYKKYIILILLSFICILIFSLYVKPNEVHPNRNYPTYILNTDNNKAIWASQYKPDQWVSKYLQGVKEGNVERYSRFVKGEMYYSDAKVFNLAPPGVTVVSDSIKNKRRTLKLEVASVRSTQRINVLNNTDTKIISVKINGKSVQKFPNNLNIVFEGTQKEGFILEITFKSSERLNLVVNDNSYELPNNFIVRPSSNMKYTEQTIVQKSYGY